MVYFPNTLPRGLRLELGNQSDYRNNDDLIVKLEKKPQNLLVFLRAGIQSVDWCVKSRSLVTLLVTKITDKVLDNLLPLDHSISICTQIFKNHAYATSYISDITILQLKSGQRYCRLVLINASPVLKEFFFTNPHVNLLLLFSLGEYLINIEEFNLLYSIFVTGDYHHCLNIETTTLQRLIHQAKAWQCGKICDELQKIMTLRLVDYISVAGEYAIAVNRDLGILREYCKTFMENARFMVVPTAKGLPNYIFHDVVIDVPELKGFLSSFEEAQMSGKLVDEGNGVTIPIRTSRFCMTVVEPGWIAVGRTSTPEAGISSDLFEIREKAAKGSFFEPEKIETIVSDGKNLLPNISLIGLLLYFKNVKALELNFYPNISEDFLCRIGEVRPDLETLGIGDYFGTTDLLKVIPVHLRNLKRIYFTKIVIPGDCLNDLLLKSNITQIGFSACKIELPKDLSIFYRVISLTLNHLESFNEDNLKGLFSACVSLLYLHLCNVSHFSLKKHCLPKTLMSLVIDADVLNSSITADLKIPALDDLNDLKILTVSGFPSEKLKSVLIHLMKTRNIQVKFSKP